MIASGGVAIRQGSSDGLGTGIDIYASPDGKCTPLRIFDCQNPPKLIFSLDGSGILNPVNPKNLAGAVILAPPATGRNLIVPTSDSARGLEIQPNSTSATASLIRVANFDGSSGMFAVRPPNSGNGYAVFCNSNSGFDAALLVQGNAGGGAGALAVYTQDVSFNLTSGFNAGLQGPEKGSDS